MAEVRDVRVMDAAAIGQALDRMAREILERHPEGEALALVGIRTRGVPLAHRLQRLLGGPGGRAVPVGVLDITLYRDDLTTVGPQPVLKETRLSFPIEGRRIVLVDDVLYTGRTIRAALDGLVDFGRPRSIQLAVLVDRGLRELPIHADYVGRMVVTRPDEQVSVLLQEVDDRDEVVLTSRAAGKIPAGAGARAKAAKRPSARGRRRAGPRSAPRRAGKGR